MLLPMGSISLNLCQEEHSDSLGEYFASLMPKKGTSLYLFLGENFASFVQKQEVCYTYLKGEHSCQRIALHCTRARIGYFAAPVSKGSTFYASAKGKHFTLLHSSSGDYFTLLVPKRSTLLLKRKHYTICLCLEEHFDALMPKEII